ncbi:hypothetical protein GJ496_005120 [Pomphorhynchus laevis]|nr:hypothetical protein GJ496_005120 [Pomphorhynchus laevis]
MKFNDRLLDKSPEAQHCRICEIGRISRNCTERRDLASNDKAFQIPKFNRLSLNPYHTPERVQIAELVVAMRYQADDLEFNFESELI